MWQGYVMKLITFGMLSAVVLNIMPKDLYKKYIRLVLGFLLMIIILEPVTSLFGEEAHLKQIFEDVFSNIEELEARPEYKEADEAYQDLLKGLYERQVKEEGEEPWVTEN